MDPDDVLQVVASVRDGFQREKSDALRNLDFHKAQIALAGMFACYRVERALLVRMKSAPVPVARVAQAR